MNNISLFNKVGDDILRTRDIDSLLEIAVDRLAGALEAERATFYFFNEETQELWSYVATDLEIKEVRVGLGEGIVGRAALNKRLLNVKDAYKCHFFNKNIDKKTGYRTKAVICSPLIDRDGKLVGALQVLNKKSGYFTEEDENILRNLSLYITISLENIRLLEEHEALFRSTLYALAQAIDSKDPATAGHSYRVAYFSVKIAKELKYSEEELKTIEYAAYLHDVGKIGVPDRVLLKRNRLTAGEYALMKKHPLHTLRILKNIIFNPKNKMIPFIASYHHECLDGSGYPFGLKSKQLNMLSRIIAVADVYDALVSFDRPYKKSFSIKEALKTLKSETQKRHLDKRIVYLFIAKELYKYERRKYKRVDLHTSISYQIIPERRIFREHIKDRKKIAPCDLDVLSLKKNKGVNISQGGVLFFTSQYLPLGLYLDLEIEFVSGRIRCMGRVVWTEKAAGAPYYKVRVAFMNISSRTRKALSRLISKISS